MKRRDLIRRALLAGRRFAVAERALILESSCLLDKSLRPRIETLEPNARPSVRRCDRAISQIDRALEMFG